MNKKKLGNEHAPLASTLFKTTDHLTPNNKLFNIKKKVQLLASSSQSENIWKKEKKNELQISITFYISLFIFKCRGSLNTQMMRVYLIINVLSDFGYDLDKLCKRCSSNKKLF